MRFFFFLFWILVAAAQMTVLWSLQEEVWVLCGRNSYIPTVSFSGNHFCSGKGELEYFWLSLKNKWHPTPVLLPRKSHGQRSLVGCSPWGREESDTTERLHFHVLEKEMATYSSVLAWRIPGTGEPGGLPSVGSHRVERNWSDLAAAAKNNTTVILIKKKNSQPNPCLATSITQFSALWGTLKDKRQVWGTACSLLVRPTWTQVYKDLVSWAEGIY